MWSMSQGNSVPTFWAHIYIAGDIAHARQACREYCLAVGLCVTIEPLEFIYTGGEEAGIRVGLINYPRFPSDPPQIKEKATALAGLLKTRLCQHSYSIVTPDETVWHSTRDIPEGRFLNA